MTERVAPLSLEDLPESVRAQFEAGAKMMGYLPNDGLLMARRDGLVPALVALTRVAYGEGQIPPGLKRMVAVMASSAAGCSYCEAHTTHGAVELGVDEAKLAAIWTYEDNELFDEAEKAALRMAHKASLVPNALEDSDFDALRDHFDDDAIVELATVIALFGFLNRWNSTLGTRLEPKPEATRQRVKPNRPSE